MRKDLMMLSAASVVMFGMTACGPDWDQMDPPAGGQVYSSLVKLASYTFDEGTAEPVNGRDFTMYAYDGGDFPALAKEGSELENPRATQFLNLNGGYARVLNPVAQARSERVAGSTSQDAVSLVFYVKQNAEHASTFKQTTLFSFQNADGTQQVAMTANGGLVVNGVDGDYSFNTSDEVTTGMLPADDEWHKVAVAIRDQNYFVYVDGEKRIDYTPQTSYKYSQIDMGKVVDFMAVAPYLYIGENSYETVEDKAAEYAWLVDDIDIYRNTITEKEWSYKKNSGGGGGETDIEFYAPVYFQSFDGYTGDCTIYGAGSIVYRDQQHGKVFANVSTTPRSNYLVMPSDLFTLCSETQEITISFWVNRGTQTAGYFYSPLFSAYGQHNPTENTFPMMVCQTRGLLQVNNAGWSDYTNEQNVKGANVESTEWLDDGKWHLYCATFTPTTAAVYIDGVVMNQWEIDGVGNTAAGLFTDASALQYICLGGNQAWNWADNDAGFWFDDFAIYNHCISTEQMQAIIEDKAPSYLNTFEGGAGDASVFGGGTFGNEGSYYGNVFKNALDGMRTNYLQLPAGVLSKAVSGAEALTIGFWVNRGNQTEGYFYCPLFSAYGQQNTVENTFPMMVCQSRGLLQVNIAGWSDYTSAQNLAGINTESTVWLDDGRWHYYTCVITATTAVVYIDGEVLNQWEIDGVTNTAAGLFTNAADLNTICLGGNQAWNWGDPDPAFWFDDISIFGKAVTPEEIKTILMAKKYK